jgi:hypothetical protein
MVNVMNLLRWAALQRYNEPFKDNVNIIIVIRTGRRVLRQRQAYSAGVDRKS